MALNYQLSDIKDWRELLYGDGVTPVTQRVIFYTMAVGIGQITEANYIEFAARVRVIEGLDGVRAQTSVADIKRLIGLRTNVTNEKQAAWLKRTYEHTLREVTREAKR